MATVKTHDLISCNPNVTPTLPSVNNSGIYPYNGSIVRFDGNDIKTYTVRKNVQGRFRHPDMPHGPVEGEPSGTRAIFSLTSMMFNGDEYMVAPANITLDYTDLIRTNYPLYTGAEYGYTSNLANGVYVTSSPTDLGLNYNNFYQFVEGIINTNDISVNISRSPALWWSPESFVRLDNFILEKYWDDDFEFTVEATYIDNQDDSVIYTVENRYVFNQETVNHYVDGVNINTIPGEEGVVPQFSDAYSFFSFNYNYTTIEELNNCTQLPLFNAIIQNNSCSGITTNCDCTKITFGDNSTYINGIPGHGFDMFTSRTITITKPNGDKYVYGTSDIEGVDEVIQPHYNSSNVFVYNFQQGDVDGIYEIELCTYPDWQSDITYELVYGSIVRKDGKLYKIIATNTNADPSIPANSAYWAEYSCVGNCNDTRYCTKEKIVVLCLSLLKCYKTLVKQAFCGIDTNPCKPICDNKQFMNAMKFKVVMDELEFSVCSRDWISAQAQIDILNSLCCCNG